MEESPDTGVVTTVIISCVLRLVRCILLTCIVYFAISRW